MSKFTFKLLAGNYRSADKKNYNSGDIVESDRELDKIFVNKFSRVGATEAPTEPPKAPADSAPANNDKTPASAPDDDDKGENITAEYPDAVDAGLEVYKKSGWCTVLDPETGDHLNKTGLRENLVADFIEDHLAAE